MKKFISVLCILLLLAIATPAAASTEYILTLMDIEISVDIPDGYDTFTRDLDQHTDLLDKYHKTKEEMTTMLRNEHRYLEALNLSTNHSLMVSSTMDQNSINLWSYSEKSKDTIEGAIRRLKKEADTGLEVSYYEADNGYQFIKNVYGLNQPESIIFATVEGGRNIEIAAYAFGGETLTEQDIVDLEQTVQSFKLRTLLPGAEQRAQPKSPFPIFLLVLILGIAAIVAVLVLRRRRRHKHMLPRQGGSGRKVTSKKDSSLTYELLDEDKKLRYGNVQKKKDGPRQIHKDAAAQSKQKKHPPTDEPPTKQTPAQKRQIDSNMAQPPPDAGRAKDAAKKEEPKD